MYFVVLAVSLLLIPSLANAQDRIRVWISNEIVPESGGTGQVKIFLYTPRAISSGSLYLDVTRTNGAPASSIASSIAAATVFSATGDAFAVSDTDSGYGFGLTFSSASATIGRIPNLPIAAFTYQTSEPMTIDLAEKSRLISGGKSFPLEVLPGSVTLNPQGVARTNVNHVSYPATVTGVLPGGSNIQIEGAGFTVQSTAEIEGAATNTVSITPNSITLNLQAPTMLRGRRLRITQPGANTVDYWFGTDSGTYTFPGPASSAIDCTPGGVSLSDPNRLIIHNPNSNAADVTISNAYDPADRSMSPRPATFATSIPAGGIYSVGTTDPPATTIRTKSQTPLRAICAAFHQGGGPLLKTFQPTYPSLAPPPAPAFVVSAASIQQGAIAPGQIVTLFGTGLGPTKGVSAALDSEGNVADELEGVRVRFNGFAAPLLYVSENQVNAVVPYEISSGNSTVIELQNASQTSTPQSTATVAARPGVFTTDGTGQGQATVLNQDGTANNASNAAAIGSTIQIFATGAGPSTPVARTGSITASTNIPAPPLQVRVFIGGLPAEVRFAGAAPLAVAGLLQVNAVVPPGLGFGDSFPIELRVGSAVSPTTATVAVRQDP